ncbi:2-amino-4-hydroxy-6-hydroxymethyldihydropteridine diphosphokinase [Reinekea marinisedimentorum]|uniref:2-amino-4-hydroxy-6-hydroxymethyldihydropteridine diphosphokinase n=1 Tax=Reinekea marinisedimentorum TaxID=230495 RepID=A0A4R3IAQ1_9GAMM|nr:2-amino-4-hydroxy-6-hydroxymethyldihydropteridine diphosphokinase [Reinekea marinisedimentorum]TCS43054.1 2-amino-4-hydroxy-6-hydroxymethyldihydropteridine diphosphokinase [Reinekea marinisedimentorum]
MTGQSLNKQQVALSLGSNVDRYRNINAGLKALHEQFGALDCSPVYESASVGFDGSPFLNMVAVICTDLSLTELIARLKQIEDDHGRDRRSPKFSPRTLDIDVVTYGAQAGVVEGIELPRPELFFNAFVTLPLSRLLPGQTVPGKDYTFLQLWQEQGNRQQWLQEVEFRFSYLD